MKKIALVYWPRKGSVEKNAKRIHEQFGESHVEVMPLKDLDPDILLNYPYLIFGCSTVGADSWQNAWTGNQWFKFFVRMKDKNISMKGKIAAIFGLGDQILYPQNFVDEMITIKKELESRGATVVGKWPAKDYENTDSKSLIDKFFIGLALDEQNQGTLSDARVKEWVNDLKNNHFLF
jgi:flavodoxin I